LGSIRDKQNNRLKKKSKKISSAVISITKTSYCTLEMFLKFDGLGIYFSGRALVQDPEFDPQGKKKREVAVAGAELLLFSSYLELPLT
jgi:hypothetical protein